jgi:hypothetical protein
MLIRQGRDMDENAKTTKLVCNDQNLLYTALNRYIKLKTLFTSNFLNVGGIAIDGGSVVNVRCSNPLFDCGVKVQELDDFISRYEKAPFIKKNEDGSLECNLTGLCGCTTDDQKKYVKGMIYDSTELFLQYHSDHTVNAKTKAKLQRSFRKLFQSLNLLMIEYKLSQEEQTEHQNLGPKRKRENSQLHRIVQERITESLSAFFLETA